MLKSTVSKWFDWSLFMSILALVFIGTFMIFSTSSVVGLSNYGDGYFFLKRHLVFLIIGTGSFLSGLMVPKSLYRTYIWGFYGACILLLAATLIPGVGVKAGGASRWLYLGFVQFQPVEVVKFVLIVFIASFLDWRKQQVRQGLKGIIPLLVVIALPVGLLISQPDLSNIVLISVTSASMLFLSKLPFRSLFALILIGFVGFGLSVATHPYQMDRIKTFMEPNTDTLGKGYHIHQSLIAIGSGGKFGQGIGQSKLKFFYLPLHYSDFIFSIVCEEGGFVLGVFVIGLFALFLKRCFVRAHNCESDFDYFLIIGLSVLLVFQMIINMGATMGVFPVTGMPLTFISFGGTSLIMSMFFVGVILGPPSTDSQFLKKEKKGVPDDSV